MTISLSVENKGKSFYERQIHKACGKLDKYFTANPQISCKILNFKRSVSVKISVNADGEQYFGEAHGIQVNGCIHKAAEKVIRMVDDHKILLERKRKHDSIKKLYLMAEEPAVSTVNE